MDKLNFTLEEKTLLKTLGIEALILFGSRAQGVEGLASDFDFGALLSDKKFLYKDEERIKIYDALYDLLSSKIKKLANIDIIFLENAPMELQSHVVKYGVPIYEKNKFSFADFRERTINMSADFAPLRSLFHKSIISRISL